MTEELKSSPRVAALKQAVEQCIKSGMSQSDVLTICKSEVFGAARLRAAIRECAAADKAVRMSFYEQFIDKQLQAEEILVAVNHAVGEQL